MTDPGRWPLVGRSAAWSAVVGALSGDHPQSIVLAGPPGVGRTRLARDALALAESQGRPVRWVTATAPGAHVPLGALAPVLPRSEIAVDPLARLQQASTAIAGDGPGPAPVLAVDDVHLLDRLSMLVLHQLASTRTVTLVLTVRTGQFAPDPAEPLWKDGLATRIELPALDREETGQLVGWVLGGPVHSRTTSRLWRASQGIPLFLRELVEEGRRARHLTEDGGPWHWQGSMHPSQRLRDIVLAQLGDLSGDEWRVLEALATAEPLEPDRLAHLSSPEAVASLERRGVLSDSVTGDGCVRAAHPLYTATIRGNASAATLRLLRSRLVAVEEDLESRAALVRRSTTHLDGDVPGLGAEVLTRAAAEALATSDLRLAVRLSTAAVRAGGGVPAEVVLMEAGRWLGQPPRSAARTDTEVHDDLQRAHVSVARALSLWCGSNGQEDAVAELLGTAVDSPTARALLTAAGSVLAYLRGDPRAAVREATAALAEDSGDDDVTLLASAGLAAGQALIGQTGEALAAVQRGRAIVTPNRVGSERLLARMVLAHAEALALHLAGRIDELERRAVEFQERVLTAPEGPMDAVAVLYRGWAALAGGRWRTATVWFAEACHSIDHDGPSGLRDLGRSLLTTGQALTGGAPEVPGPGIEEEGPSGVGIPVFAAYDVMASSAIEAARGRTERACKLLLEGAARAASQEQFAVEALLLHEAVRLGSGRQIATRLRVLARSLDAPLLHDFAAHAEAVAVADAAELDRISDRFSTRGVLLSAADAALEAAALYERNGARRSATDCRARGVALARECGVVATPAVFDPTTLPTLTSREEEVATLAVRGLSNQDIADRLVLSVRTIEAHLSHVYMKVGITSRAELVRALELAAPTTGRPPLIPFARRQVGS